MTTKVAIFGAGQIGRAVKNIIYKLYDNVMPFVIDGSQIGIDSLGPGNHFLIDLETTSVDEVVSLLKKEKIKYVINALPFHLNEKVANIAFNAGCSYIDFTEDDIMADKVQNIFRGSEYFCATKCGLAPGFINYVGSDLVKQLASTDSLMVSVGALPRDVSYSENEPEKSYNLSWSVDGLVNEYIRDCRARVNSVVVNVPALTEMENIILDGVKYEAALTSGGIGSLVQDLENVPNVCYKTLRYPGHYKFVKEIVGECSADFDAIKARFLEKFPFTNNDVIVVYANALGKDKNGVYTRKSYSNKFYGVDGLTAIQSTTAGSGVAMLEMMIEDLLPHYMVTHTNIDFKQFQETTAFRHYYKSH